ncbi:MAG: hypothetical protein ABL934_09710 [Lysobacteraceae bacterium]
MKIRRCHVCKCTDTNACPGGCRWIGEDLCSSCGPRAARHLRERPLLLYDYKFRWRRRVDIEMGFVTYCMRYVVQDQIYWAEESFDILEIQRYGRSFVAHRLHKARFLMRIQLAQLQGVTQEPSNG